MPCRILHKPWMTWRPSPGSWPITPGRPFGDKVLPLVQACTTHGTCDTDSTAEVPLPRVSYDRYHNDAVASGALIIHACAYDKWRAPMRPWCDKQKRCGTTATDAPVPIAEVHTCGVLGGVAHLGGFAMPTPPTRWLLLKYVLPKPGEGPSEEVREHGFFHARLYAVGARDGRPRPQWECGRPRLQSDRLYYEHWKPVCAWHWSGTSVRRGVS
jgi:hypothetical protein